MQSGLPQLAKYELLEEIGHGGMATVYRARDVRLGREVAIKIIHKHLRENAEVGTRFIAEARAAANLHNPGIVEVFDVSSEDDSERYLVVELLRGATLRKVLVDHRDMPPEVGAAIVLELCEAVEHAHEAAIIHRDIKPENVLVELPEDRALANARGAAESAEHDSARPVLAAVPTPSSSRREGRAQPAPVADASDTQPSHRDALASGETGPRRRSEAAEAADVAEKAEKSERIKLREREREVAKKARAEGLGVIIKLTDFGIAKILDAQGVTSTGQVLGSPAHMAPEQIEGGDVDGRADVFGMGVLLYECMVGHLPFEGNNPAQVLRRVLDGVYPSAEREQPPVGKVYSQILDRALARQAEDRYANAEVMREALAAELSRLGIATPRTELESYFDDPEVWSAEHEKRLIGRLCDLGSEARKRGDAVAAASDYNRALAYAPNDPQLLRIVASMHRAEARMRLARRAGPLVLGALVLGTSAFFVARQLKGSPTLVTTPDVPTSNGALLTGPGPSAARSVSPLASASAVSSGERPVALSIGTLRPANPTIADAAVPGKKRSVVISSLQPQFGVKLTIDGAPGPDPGAGMSFLLPDEKAHALTFTCQDRDGNELCVPKTVAIAPGDTEAALDVQLAILPAKLVVEGESNHAYGILEVPNVTLAPGVATDIPMLAGRADRSVTVFDRADPEKGRAAPLRAGQKYVLSFKAP